jgi:hypothetical protein
LGTPSGKVSLSRRSDLAIGFAMSSYEESEPWGPTC